MPKHTRIQLFILLVFSSIFLTGCMEKTFFPAAEIEVTSVDPTYLIPTATATAELPTTDITIKSLNKVPCSLKSYSVKYTTPLGEEITSASYDSAGIEAKLDAEGELVVKMMPYSLRILDLFELSSSSIAPVTARMTFNFEDYNGNWNSVVAHCRLYPPDVSSE
jgi:hypothetical protein